MALKNNKQTNKFSPGPELDTDVKDLLSTSFVVSFFSSSSSSSLTSSSSTFPSSSLFPFTPWEFCFCWLSFCLRVLISLRRSLMRLVRPPLVRMEVTTSSLSSKALTCSSVLKCNLLSGSNRESTIEGVRGTKTRGKGGERDETWGECCPRHTTQLTVIPRAVVEAMLVTNVWEMHPGAGVQANALKLPVGVSQNGSTHLPHL